MTSLNWPSRASYSRRVLQIVGLKWPAQPAISTACRIIPFQRASRQIFTCSTQSAVGLFLLLLFRTVQLEATSDLSASIPATILGLQLAFPDCWMLLRALHFSRQTNKFQTLVQQWQTAVVMTTQYPTRQQTNLAADDWPPPRPRPKKKNQRQKIIQNARPAIAQQQLGSSGLHGSILRSSCREYVPQGEASEGGGGRGGKRSSKTLLLRRPLSCSLASFGLENSHFADKSTRLT